MQVCELKIYGLILCAALPLSGCSKAQERPTAAPVQRQPMKPVPATPIDKKKAELGEPTWDPEWNRIIEQALPASMVSREVPRDVRRFCPNFYGMSEKDKRVFWAYFFQALAGAEAGLNPQATVRHTDLTPADSPTGVVPGRTQGLLQLSYKDEKRYGCDFDPTADKGLKLNDPARTILNPKNNLICGIKILENQIIEQRKPLLSRTSYWSTLQPGTAGYRMFAKQMTNPPATCHVPAKKGRASIQMKTAE